MIKCACGCGGELLKYDEYGRKRKFIVGHGNRNQGIVNFWKNVNKTKHCWIWKAAKTKAGYGQINLNYKRVYTHILVFEWTYGKIIKGIGLEVMHKCDNPACCNPKHLVLGTHCDNMKDCIAKNRSGLKQYASL